MKQLLGPTTPPPEPPSAKPSSQCLAYVLTLTPQGLQVKPWLVRILNKGGYGTQRKAVGYHDTDVAPYYRKDYHGELDLRILGALRAQTAFTNGVFPLRGEAGTELLTLMLRTGHCHWQELDSPALTLAQAFG